MARLKIGNIKGPTGATGQNGVSITGIELKETSTNGSKVYNLILSNGNKLEFTAPIGPIGNTGPKGEQGVQGVQGVGIKSIVYKNNDSSGGNVYTITLTNNNTYEFTAPKGAKGDRGEKGEPGESTAVSLRWDDILEKPSSFPSAWGSVAGKPSSFTPSAHNHAWSEITGKPTVFPTSWSNVSGKPATFPPDSHTHPYLSTSGGTVSGNLTVTGRIVSNEEISSKGVNFSDLISRIQALENKTNKWTYLGRDNLTIPSKYKEIRVEHYNENNWNYTNGWFLIDDLTRNKKMSDVAYDYNGYITYTASSRKLTKGGGGYWDVYAR